MRRNFECVIEVTEGEINEQVAESLFKATMEATERSVKQLWKGLPGFKGEVEVTTIDITEPD